MAGQKDRMDEDLITALNLRDLGGVATDDGGRMRRGRVFRSAALSDLSGERLETVRALGIRTVVDLRRNAERAQCPTPWETMGCLDYWSRDHDLSDADHRARRRGDGFTAEDARASMVALYAGLPYQQADSYSRLFGAIADGRGPVLFHCAVGKDRTGVAAALILSAAGVGREAIQADYAATAQFDIMGSPHVRGSALGSPERAAAFAPLLGTDPAYLDAAFAAIEQRSGSLDAYLRDTLGLDARAQAALRTELVETG